MHHYFFEARFDAMELVGWVAGSLVSPSIYYYLGNYGCYTSKFICLLIGLIWLIKFVPEPIKTEPLSNGTNKNKIKFLKTVAIDSARDMFKTVIKVG